MREVAELGAARVRKVSTSGRLVPFGRERGEPVELCPFKPERGGLMESTCGHEAVAEVHHAGGPRKGNQCGDNVRSGGGRGRPPSRSGGYTEQSLGQRWDDDDWRHRGRMDVGLMELGEGQRRYV